YEGRRRSMVFGAPISEWNDDPTSMRVPLAVRERLDEAQEMRSELRVQRRIRGEDQLAVTRETNAASSSSGSWDTAKTCRPSPPPGARAPAALGHPQGGRLSLASFVVMVFLPRTAGPPRSERGASLQEPDDVEHQRTGEPQLVTRVPGLRQPIGEPPGERRRL